MNKILSPVAALLAASLLVGCGSNTSTTAPNTTVSSGNLIYNPPLRIASLDAATFNASLSQSATGQGLLHLAGAPTCGVDFYYIEYYTKGGAGENTTASGALMVPTGVGSACNGPRPLVLYAHGTTVDKLYNIADITNPANAEGALVAAVFAAQGYIVVAPNYAGYDNSGLAYHPYLNADQQSGEMIDALGAARTAMSKLSTPVAENGKLFLTGYSQGGHVAMATLRKLQANQVAVTASAPASGPYALEAFGDAIFYGNVNLGSTVFSPLMVSSYQHAYHNIYASTTDVFSTTYATGIDTLLPSTSSLSTLFSAGKLPLTALFDSTTPVTGNAQLDAALAVPANPLFAAGFGSPYLVENNYRLSYVLDAAADPDGAVPAPQAGVPLAANAPAQTLRHALWQNDLRNDAGATGAGWFPMSPMLMCGGNQDPTVFFSVNTGTMQAYWSGLPAGLINVLDVSGTPGGPFAPLQGAFQQSQAQEYTALTTTGGKTPAEAQQQMVTEYHGAVAPFCTVAARAFFANF